MSSKRASKSTTWNIFLFFSFWLILVVECYALYKREYALYTYSRIWIAPILIARILTSEARRVNLYVLFFYFSSLLADAFVLFGNYNIAYIGLSFFSISYLTMGCYFNQINQNHHKSHIIMGVASALIITLNLLWIFAPELRAKVFYIQSAAHSFIIIFVIYSLVNLGKRLRGQRVFKLLSIAVALIALTNIIYAVDVLYAKRAYPLIDALVGFGNGAYLYVFTKGIFAHLKRVA